MQHAVKKRPLRRFAVCLRFCQKGYRRVEKLSVRAGFFRLAPVKEAERQRRLAAAMQLTRRLGGVFCGMALGVGLCYTFETGRFFSIALPLLLSGWGAMFWLFRRAFR